MVFYFVKRIGVLASVRGKKLLRKIWLSYFRVRGKKPDVAIESLARSLKVRSGDRQVLLRIFSNWCMCVWLGGGGAELRISASTAVRTCIKIKVNRVL
jgi:hypothetical protein